MLRTVVVVLAALTLVGCASSGQAVSVTETVTESVTVTATAPAQTVTETTTATATPTTSATRPSATTRPAADVANSPIETQQFKGKGDDVLSLHGFTDMAVIIFKCLKCQGNTIVDTDGNDGLLVNTIGPYAGAHLVNTKKIDVINRVTISATGAWTLDIADYRYAPSDLTGELDTVILVPQRATQATIDYSGEGNFIVKVYSENGGTDLAVNTIGNYHGTVPFNTPGLVQVIAWGPWSISPS